ncbi:MAG: type 4a pilus biogenesis protein PilO [Planctomycetota bacterium]
MSSSRHFIMAVLALIAVVGLGGLLLAWPAYREAAALDRQTEELRAKGERYDLQAQQIAQLSAALEEATRRVDTGLKPIPETPDVAGLMRVLSLAVDGSNVRDQMFDAGDSKDAAFGSELTTQVTPLTIDMEARFDAVFALLRTAESMDRLLRVSTVQVVCNRVDEDEEPFTKATVVLEAVYNPPEEGGGG